MTGELERLARRFQGHEPGLLGASRSYAVLCPLVESEGGLRLLFEVRSSQVSQGGEVCFPGGQMEPGETPQDCALRETEEELSIPREAVTLLGTPDFICNQRGFLLRPVLGLVSQAGLQSLRPSPAEVAEAFTVPLAFFRETPPDLRRYELVPQVPEDFPYGPVGIPRDYPWSRGQVEIPIWRYQGRAIWGMTARLVREIIR
ncbi:MAG: CoA pyrophosphatase [Oscillibacter sp.]|uniref:NUDIX hydrolase n=1 Tax=Oscillibacter sp. TaxID=1945593 RepID=UPI002171B52C|nr:CoA pyrophosphatase [Oscillibacter sp.]MCI8842403.1 CoA pyrophosphatase [Oscillibacter sp.]MCI9114305.1 CoA pyrophosphatase [Oscillibacter sp.]